MAALAQRFIEPIKSTIKDLRYNAAYICEIQPETNGEPLDDYFTRMAWTDEQRAFVDANPMLFDKPIQARVYNNLTYYFQDYKPRPHGVGGHFLETELGQLVVIAAEAYKNVVSSLYNDANAVEQLLSDCGSLMQARFYYPALPALLYATGDDDLKKASEEIRHLKVPSRFLPYPPESIQQLRDMSTTHATLLLSPKQPELHKKRGFRFT